jgi:uncharacterized protein YjbI with pentapeptide repeats
MTEIDFFYEIAGRGADAWNDWRREHPGARPEFADEDLSEMKLAGINLAESDLSGADLFESDLSKANLKMARLPGSDLSGANLAGAELYKADLTEASLIGADLEKVYFAEARLVGADLRGANLRNANLSGADLSGANLGEADLTGANLQRTTIEGANLRNANLEEADVSGMDYGSFRSMRGRYYGIRGLGSCFGSALFVRDAKDQDYLDTLKNSIEETTSPRLKRWKRFWFAAWGVIDYGRSITRVFAFAFVMAMTFGVIFSLDKNLGWGLLEYPTSAESVLSPFYHSVVTYTKLGFGYMKPTHWIGEIILVCEGILGYITLGLLLSILANRVARRS